MENPKFHVNNETSLTFDEIISLFINSQFQVVEQKYIASCNALKF